MKGHLQIAVFAALVVTGCNTMHVSDHPAGLPLCYRNARYGLAFYLPPTWRDYSVSVQQLDDERYSPTDDKRIVVGHTPMIVLRHPQWQTSAPYQDVPILVFTRIQ